MLRFTYSAIQLVELADLAQFLPEGADDARAGQIFLRPRRKRGELLLNPRVQLVGDFAEVEDGERNDAVR